MAGLFPFMVPDAGSVSTVVYENSYTRNAAARSSETYSSCDIGTASSGRWVIVAIGASSGGQGATSVNAVTIGGVSATEIADGNNSTALVAFYVANVPTGTTGDVVITYASNVVATGIGIWTCEDLQSTSYSDIASGNGDPYVDTIDCPAGGFIIGFMTMAPYPTGNVTTTWTNLTENFDTVIATYTTVTGASDNFEAAQTSLSITADPSATPAEAYFATYISMK